MKAKTYVLRFLYIVILVLGIVGIYKVYDYFWTDDTSSQSRVTIHEFYETEDVDYVFLGPSHTVHSINAVELSELTGKNIYNLGTKNQDFLGSYYLLKAALTDKPDIEEVFFEFSISRLKIKSVDETRTYIISDYLENPLIRAEMLLDAFGPDKWINAFFRLRRNIDPSELPEYSKVNNIYRKKQLEKYTSYLGNSKYMGKGQWADGTTMGYNGTLAFDIKSNNLNNIAVENIQEWQWDYFMKIVKMCQEKGVKLNIYITPCTEVFFAYFPGYEDVMQRLYDTCDEYNLPLIDMNRVKKEYLDYKLSDFYNLDHLASDYSHEIAKFLAVYLADRNGDYFYDEITDRYPVHDNIIAVSYKRSFVTENGTYSSVDKAKGTISNLKVQLSAFGYQKFPAYAKLWTVSKDKETQEYTLKKEMEGEITDEYTTVFLIPYDSTYKTSYWIQLFDPETDELIYETLTQFNTD